MTHGNLIGGEKCLDCRPCSGDEYEIRARANTAVLSWKDRNCWMLWKMDLPKCRICASKHIVPKGQYSAGMVPLRLLPKSSQSCHQLGSCLLPPSQHPSHFPLQHQCLPFSKPVHH